MLEELKSAADQLHAAWDNYHRVYSNLEHYPISIGARYPDGFHLELIRQLDTERAFISSYEPKIQQIKTSISRVRNYRPGLISINSLPSEILTRIFQLVLAQPCTFQLSNNEMHYPRYPDYFTRVCSLWRKIAIASRLIWCHIDISHNKPCCDRLVARANTYLMRAGELPIELHIMDDDHNTPGWREPDYDDLYRLVRKVSSRVETLQFGITKVTGFQKFHRDTFEGLFRYGPARLKKLVLRSNRDAFIRADISTYIEPDERTKDLILEHPEWAIETAFTPVTTLHLRGIFPVWSSKAYSGLVDLRMVSSNGDFQIEQMELITILRSSPALRILHFGLNLGESTPGIEETTQIHLKDLEVVKIFPELGSPRTPRLLKLLAPGTKPLRLSFEDYHLLDAASLTDLEAFLARSRVARFYIGGTFLPINILLPHANHLEHVVLDAYVGDFGGISPPEGPHTDPLPLSPRLRSLHITRSSLLADELRLLSDHCPTGIVLHSCDIYWGRESGYAQDLSVDFPLVNVTEHTLYPFEEPTASWDILD
ncbi:unnamed protein product [Rhizoctonia solani]|uniref:F-box-like domain protein n=1 Tax=Rhizoctonia solani TaxID=456999 RepID=A0A8H3GF34_9AGAM|nr:unnamed protein product [Rhizoctonia solani]